jgi:glycosyltransferase involved in cell wall biosynthesis
VLLCPCHYLFDEMTEGSEFSWAFAIGDRVARRLPHSVVVTGAANLRTRKPYAIVELQPQSRSRERSLAEAWRFNWKYSLATYRLARDHQFDIIHHVLPFAISTTYNLSWLVRRQKRPKLVLGPVQQPLDVGDTESLKGWDVWAAPSIRGVLRPVLSSLSKQTIRRADKIIAISERAKELLLAAGAVPSKVEIIPPGIDVNQFAYVSMEKKSKDRVELLAVGHLRKRKAVDLIVKAVKELIGSRLDVHLTIVGDGPQRERLQEMVSHSALDQYVQFTGAVPNSEIHQYYRRAHIFVNMSISESFGVVGLEAMASGLAIVATPVGVFSSAISPGRNGYLVAQGDYRDLAARIAGLIDDRGKMSSFGSIAREQAVSKFDWDRAIIPRYLEVYEDLAHQR